MSKKILAFVLATTMIVGSSITALADDTTSGATGTKLADYGDTAITGTATDEGLVDTHKYRVVLPVIPDTSLSYTIDPQGLVKATAGKAYGDSITVGEGNLFFKNHETLDATTEAAVTGVSADSDKFSVVNKSSFPITVTIKTRATVEASPGTTELAPTLATTDTPATKTVYLAYVDDAKNKDAAKTLTTSDQEIATVLGDASGVYEYSYVPQEGSTAAHYDYALKAGDHAFATLKFGYTGKVDVSNVTDWTVKTAATASADEVRYTAIKAPTISVLYKLEEYVPSGDPAIDVAGPTAAGGGSSSGGALVMKPNSNGVYVVSISAASGNLTKIVVGGTDRSSQIGSNITYVSSSKTIKIAAAQATNWGLASGKTVVATIGGTDYTFTTAAN